jgi:hypothetical protein
MFPNPSELLVEPLSPAKRGAKVKEGDSVPEDLEGKHGYASGTVRLGDRISLNVSCVSSWFVFFLLKTFF